jgi:hypothetical protein
VLRKDRQELIAMAGKRKKSELELDPRAYDDPDTRGTEPVEGKYPRGKKQDEVPQ